VQMALTTPDEHTMNQLDQLKQSVANTGATFIACENGKVKYFDSIAKLSYYINKNDKVIDSVELWNNIIHYVFIRTVRGGD